VDGLVHVSELSWKHVDHPSEVVAVGQEVEVQVLDVELDRERVSLSLKATQEDPWKEFERMHKAGEVIAGQVTKLVPFGAFVRVAQGIEGLVHISELSHEHVDTPESVLSVGDEVQVKVVDVDVSRRRVSLSMRQVSPAPAKTTEIEVEPEPTADSAEPLVQTVQIPQAVLDAVAEAETDEPAAPPAAEAAEPTEPSAATQPEAEAAVQPAAEPAETAVPEAPAEAPEQAPAEQPTEETPATDEEVSLEAILEDLKRREGRSE
jgi:small subunit ribosomal protein S1